MISKIEKPPTTEPRPINPAALREAAEEYRQQNGGPGWPERGKQCQQK